MNAKGKRENITMKKLLKYTGICSFILALIAFILMLSTNSLEYHGEHTEAAISGILGTFGGVVASLNLGPLGTVSATYNATWSAVIAFILILVAMIILLAGFILPLLKIHTLDKVAGILNLVAVLALIVAGIFLFIELPCFVGAQNGNVKLDNWTLGAGWIVGGIMCLFAGVVAILPAAFDFLGKKK